MKLTAQEAARSRYLMVGVGMIRKTVFKQGVLKDRRQDFRSLTDDELNSCLKSGIRVHDKRRGIYVHI